MTSNLAPVSVDMKRLIQMTGFSRQRLNVIRKDPKLGFPESLTVGRSVRWLDTDIQQWMQAMKRSNVVLRENLVAKSVPIAGQTLTAKELERALDMPLLPKKPVPTVKDILAQNYRATSCSLQHGQDIVTTMVLTKEGTSLLRYEVVGIPLVDPQLGIRRVEVRTHKRFEANVSLAEQMQYFAVRAAILTGRMVPSMPILEQPNLLTPADVPVKEMSLVDLKNAYESGLSQDKLCQQYRMSKSRLGKLLREAGAKMRPAGRKPLKRLDLPRASLA